MKDILPDSGFTMVYHSWLRSGISDSEFRTLIAIYSLWNPGHCRWVKTPTVKTVAEIRGIHVETAKQHFRAIEKAGLITRSRARFIGGGSEMTLTINLPDQRNPVARRKSDDFPPKEVRTLPSEGSSIASFTKEVRSLPSIKENNEENNFNLNNDDDGGRRTPSAESGGGEPFELPESANVASLPKVGHLPLRPSLTDRPTHVPVQVPQELRDRIYTTLGTYGDLFVANLTQEMVDRDGYVVDVLRSCQGGRKPIALALKILKDFGNWISPVERHEADKKLREEIFWRRMGVAK